MNCYEFTAIDGMKMTFTVSGQTFNGVQVNTSHRPTKRICLQCKSRYTLQDADPPAPPRKFNACSQEEFHSLAVRVNAGCFRFRTNKLAWEDGFTILDNFGNPFYLSFQENWLGVYVYPPLLEPWDEQDPYYYRSRLYYDAMKNFPTGSRLGCKMWLRNGTYSHFNGIPVNFSEFESGSIGIIEGSSDTVSLQIEF